jgi:3-oxoacyl-[acyl-carrier-protein] synthase II
VALREALVKTRVVITGLGVVAPTGIGKEAFWGACKEGRSGIRSISRFDTEGFPCKIGGEVRGFDPLDYMAPKQAKRSDRFSQFAIASAKMAVEDGGLDLQKTPKDRIGVYFGAAMGGMSFAEMQHSIFMEKGLKRVSPFLAETIFPGATSCHIAIDLGAKGINETISTGCSSGTDAIGQALDAIRNGRADIMIAGGTEDPLAPLTFASFCVIKALTTSNGEPEKATKPFDLNRNGFALSEGAGALVLESLDHAEKRGASIYAELAGYGCSCDAYHMVHPSPDGMELSTAMRLALEDANVRSEDVDYINAHGTSTVLGDAAETKAIKRVFGERAYHIPISSIKSGTGHVWGAAGALESIACVLAIQDRFIPPTTNYETPDPECDLDYVPNEGRAANLDLVVSNSSSFGGKNSVLVVSRFAGGRAG